MQVAQREKGVDHAKVVILTKAAVEVLTPV